MKKRIRVTAKDIREGEKHNARSCPIARACVRAGLEEPKVTPEYVSFAIDVTAGPLRRSTNLPLTAKKFVQAFDAGLIVQPFQFTIDV
jgi:hypothetical protein